MPLDNPDWGRSSVASWKMGAIGSLPEKGHMLTGFGWMSWRDDNNGGIVPMGTGASGRVDWISSDIR